MNALLDITGRMQGVTTASLKAALILRELSTFIKPGVTTVSVDKTAELLMEKHGCKSAFKGYRGFPGHICISINEEVVHGIGCQRRISYGDVVKLDVGVQSNGWYGDTATSIVVGPPLPHISHLLSVTETALLKGISVVKVGARTGDIGYAIESYVNKHGMSVVRDFVGHGVGRSLHEEPQVPNFGKRGQGFKLTAGMTIAIEPMVTIGSGKVKTLTDNWTVVTSDGSLSAHFEHTVLVTNSGAEILTKYN